MALISSLSFVSHNLITTTTPTFSQFQSAKYRKPIRHHISKIACSENTLEGEKLPHRRNVLLGLGGFCGAAVMSLNNKNIPFASAAPTPMFPLVLDSAVSMVVKRPSKSRSKKQKEEEEEVLVIEGIEFEGNTHAKFDVIINADDYNEIRPDHTEFAGSFASLPHSNNKKIVTSMSLGLTDLLEDLGADDDDSVVVTLVPRDGRVKIRAIKTRLLAE